jgi:hypothetical protein
MEVCILKFKKAGQAEDALAKLVDERGDQEPWLHEVGIIKRPFVGRISIRATYSDPNEVREGDIASEIAEAGKWTGYLVGCLAGPLRARITAFRFKSAVTPAAKELENLLLGIDDIKELLARGSSALLLVATPEVCDRMVALFSPWKPDAIRRDFGAEVRQLLEDIHRQVEQGREAAAE